MRFVYGPKSYPIGLVKVDETMERVRNEGHGTFLVKRRLTVKGILKSSAATEADLTLEIEAMEANWALQNQSGGLLQTDNSQSAHWLDNATSYQGVRTLPLQWSGGSPAEYAAGGFRTFTAALEADYLTLNQIISQEESIEITGTGGPVKAYGLLITQVAQSQTVNLFSLTTAVQRGSAVWTTGTHAIPDPLWPTLEDVDRRALGRVTVDLNTRRHSRTWAYHFTNNGPFILPLSALSGTQFVFDIWTTGAGDRLVWQNGDFAVF